MCIVVHATPNGGSVDKESLTNIKVTVKQRYEGTELDKPVEATFSGVASLDPLGQKQPAPASYTFTAGSTDGDRGSMSFKSVSNRGIGHTTVTFVVGKPALALEVDIRIVGLQMLGTTVIHGTIPLKYVPVEGSTTGETRLVGTDGGDMAWTTTPGALVQCGQGVVSGAGVVKGYVLAGALGATGADTRIAFMFDARPANELWTFPACQSTPQVQINSPFWSGLFIDGHADVDPTTGGILIKDWTFTGIDVTQRGIFATRTYAETCLSLCTGESTFKLILTP